MFYAIMASDAPGTLDARLAARPAHLARLQQLQNAGRLLLAGPHPAIDSNDPGEAGFTGSWWWPSSAHWQRPSAG